MFNETLFSRCLSHRGLLIFNEIGPGEADVAGRAKTGTSVESSLGLTSKDNLPETSYSIQNMKPLGLNATFEGSAMSVYQEDDPEEEEIGDGLLHSLGGGLEAYDNAIQNFQARLQRGQPNKSPKIGWTFWFLLKSVVRDYVVNCADFIATCSFHIRCICDRSSLQ